MTPTTMTTGYVRTLDPFTVEIPGVDQVAQPCQQSAPAEVGMRGRVDIVDGTRVWAGEWNTDGVPTEVRTSIEGLTEQVDGVVDTTNATTETITRFEDRYTTDQAAAAVELGDIRAGLANALTADRFASLDPGDGLYFDPAFKDAALSATRATASGLTYTGTGLSGNGNLWLSQNGADEGASLAMVSGDLYTVRVWGSGLTAANGRSIARRDNAGYSLLTTTYFAGGMQASTVHPSPGARFQVYRAPTGAPGTAAMTITRVEIRHGIGGTLIEGGAINTNHITTHALDFWEAEGMILTSPTIQTNLTAARGIKIVNDRLTGYSPTGELLIDIGGPAGLIKGVALEGVTISGSSSVTAPVMQTNSGAKGRAVLRDITDGAQLIFQDNQGGTLAEIVTRSTSESYMLMRDYKTAAGSGPTRVDIRASEGFRVFSPTGVVQGGMKASGTQLQLNTPAGGEIQLGAMTGNAGSVNVHARNSATLAADAVAVSGGLTALVEAGNGSVSISAGNGFVGYSGNSHNFAVSTVTGTGGKDTWVFRERSGTATLQYAGGRANALDTTQPGNVHMDANGYFYVNGSTRTLKHDIQPVGVDPYLVLDVPVRDWWDRHEHETGTATYRVPGTVVDEVEDAGLGLFVMRNEDGTGQNVMNERLPLLLIPIVRDLIGRIAVLENNHA